MLRVVFIKDTKVMACLLELPTTTLRLLRPVASEVLLYTVVIVLSEVCPTTAVLVLLSHLKLRKHLEEVVLLVALTMHLAAETHTKVKASSTMAPSKEINKAAVKI